jgi:hypothetical protein
MPSNTMRPDANAERIRALLVELGRRAAPGDRLYVAGGASAVLLGWRGATRDVDLRLEGDEDRLLRAIADLKERMDINVELASPLDFLPAPPNWRERAMHVGRFGALDVLHIPFALQALAKLQRGFETDLADVQAMLSRGLTTKAQIAQALADAEPDLYRFPAAHPRRLAAAVAGLPDD